MPDKQKLVGNQGGFTLLELVTTIAIGAVLMTMATAAYLSWRPGYVHRHAISQVRGDLAMAKMRAVETRRQCKVEFALDGSGYNILDGNQARNSNQWGNIDGSGQFTVDTPFASSELNDFPIVEVDNGTDITFSPRGTAESGFVDVLHLATGETVRIAVNIAGNINVDWN